MARTCFVCVLWTGGLTAGPVLAQGNTWLWETELLVYFYTMSSSQWAVEPHLHLQRRCREEGIGMGEGKGSIFSIYAWTGHEQLLLCTSSPEAAPLPSVSIQGKWRSWVLGSGGNCNGQVCCGSVPAQSALCASALQENGYKQHFPVPGKRVKNRNNKGLKLFENSIGTV